MKAILYTKTYQEIRLTAPGDRKTPLYLCDKIICDITPCKPWEISTAEAHYTFHPIIEAWILTRTYYIDCAETHYMTPTQGSISLASQARQARQASETLNNTIALLFGLLPALHAPNTNNIFVLRSVPPYPEFEAIYSPIYEYPEKKPSILLVP